MNNPSPGPSGAGSASRRGAEHTRQDKNITDSDREWPDEPVPARDNPMKQVTPTNHANAHRRSLTAPNTATPPTHGKNNHAQQPHHHQQPSSASKNNSFVSDQDSDYVDAEHDPFDSTELIQKTVGLLSAHKLAIAEMVEVRMFISMLNIIIAVAQ